MYIYVASSWKNIHQPAAVSALRDKGHDVFDFRHPADGNNGFGWSQCDKDFNAESCTVKDYGKLLSHPIAQRGAIFDITALSRSHAVLLVLPAGNDSHLELGYAIGHGKPAVIWTPDSFKAGLMYSMATFMTHDLDNAVGYLSSLALALGVGPRLVTDP